MGSIIIGYSWNLCRITVKKFQKLIYFKNSRTEISERKLFHGEPLDLLVIPGRQREGHFPQLGQDYVSLRAYQEFKEDPLKSLSFTSPLSSISRSQFFQIVRSFEKVSFKKWIKTDLR